MHISKIGSVELRQAMLALGTGLALHHPDFTAYKKRLRNAGKKPMVAAIAVAHRAHRLAFALVRSQKPYDATQWAASVAKAGPARLVTLPQDRGNSPSGDGPEGHGGRGRNNVDKYQQPSTDCVASMTPGPSSSRERAQQPASRMRLYE